MAGRLAPARPAVALDGQVGLARAALCATWRKLVAGWADAKTTKAR
jgi:hypothetical protein